MFLRRLHRLPRTLSFWLTLWYASIFGILALVAFAVFYFLIATALRGQTDQALLNEIDEFASLLEVKDIDAVNTEMVLEAGSEGVHKVFFRLLTEKGEVVASSDMSSWGGHVVVPKSTLKRLKGGADHVFETLVMPEDGSRIRMVYGAIGPGKILQIGRLLEEDQRFMAAFREIFGTIMALLMVFASLIGWFMARRALSGVDEITRTAQQISEGSFERRVSAKSRGQEIDRLATTFNNMLDQVQALVRGMREVTDNIAHDLRSPIARIRGIAEMTLFSGRGADEFEAMAANTIEECDRLLGMINAMLDISEIEAGEGRFLMVEVDLVRLVRDACELFQPIAEDKCIDLVRKLPGHYPLYGDMQRLQRMIANLLDNALKYTPSGGTVTVSINGDMSKTIISFSDTGIGISKEDLPHIFKRLYRCDRSRSQAGTGLGLSLALAIARSHGGDITAASHLGKGSTFTVSLPRAALSN